MKRELLIALLVIATTSINAQSNKKLVDKGVKLKSVKNHVQTLASDELKGRNTPSPGLDSAAAYIAGYFKEWGVQQLPEQGSYYQVVKLKSDEPATEGFFSVSDSVFDLENDMLQLSKGRADLSAPLVFVDYGSEEDFNKVDVAGKIVVARSGTRSAMTVRSIFIAGREKASIATDRGAVALIELYNSPQTKWKIIQYYIRNRQISLDKPEDSSGSTLQHLWLEDMENTKLNFLKDNHPQAKLFIDGGREEKFNSQNVVGFVKGTDPELMNEIVIYSAHYDHVGIGKPDDNGDTIYNGTRDNAIGTMTVLEAAKNIAANPLKRTALFILFTGEEKGLLGSEWYVNYPLMPLKDVVFCFNSDNAGYNDVTKTTVVGLGRTTAAPIISKSVAQYGLETIDDPVPDQNLFDRSDQVNFAREGVPAIMYSMGLTAFDEQISKYYHQAADNPDSVDYNYLLKFTRAYVLTAREIGDAVEKPYWIEGDKYFDAAETLYKSNP